jgi:hypothetical protein
MRSGTLWKIGTGVGTTRERANLGGRKSDKNAVDATHVEKNRAVAKKRLAVKKLHAVRKRLAKKPHEQKLVPSHRVKSNLAADRSAVTEIVVEVTDHAMIVLAKARAKNASETRLLHHARNAGVKLGPSERKRLPNRVHQQVKCAEIRGQHKSDPFVNAKKTLNLSSLTKRMRSKTPNM